MEYISALLNISQAKVFEFVTKDNKNTFVQILDSLLNNKDWSKKIFCEDNVRDDGVIHHYIEILKNLAYLITPEKAEYNDVAKANIRQQINTNDVKFLIKSLNKFVTDVTLRELVFNRKNNQKTIELFFDFLFNLACHTSYLENNGCFHDISDLLNVLQILLSKPFKNLLAVPKFCRRFLLCYGEIFCHSHELEDGQQKTLSDMLNTTLLSDKWSKIILENKKISNFYLIILKSSLDRNKNLVDCKSVINVMYNFFEDKNIQQMSAQNIDVKTCLSVLEDAIEQYISVKDEALNLTFKKIVCILNSIQSKDYKFKEQIFYKNEVDEQINENAKDTSTKKTFDNEISKHKNSIARLYTGMLKNISRLSKDKSTNINQKVKFVNLIKDVLIKKEHEDIRKMIFSENEAGKQGAVCNLIQVFYNLLSENNLQELNKVDKDKKDWIRLFLYFICDGELQYPIFQLCNDGKNGAIDFYFRTLCNILHSKNIQFTDENRKSVANLIQNLESKYLKAEKDFTECVYYKKVIEIKEVLGIQKTINNTEQKTLLFLKFAKNMFEPKKILKTSKSMHGLFLPDQKPKVSNKNLEKKINLIDKSRNSSNSSIKMLKTSKSTGNFLQIKKKSSNKSLTLNLNTFKPQINKANKNINSINISTGEKPQTIGKINIDKDYNF